MLQEITAGQRLRVGIVLGRHDLKIVKKLQTA